MTLSLTSSRGDILIEQHRPSPPRLGHLLDNTALRCDPVRSGVLDWPGVLGYFILGRADAAKFSDGARLDTEDRRAALADHAASSEARKD